MDTPDPLSTTRHLSLAGEPLPDQIAWLEKWMAQELHDTVCQGLAGTTFLVNVLRRQAEDGIPVQTGDLQKVAVFLERTMADLRAIVSPDSLAGAGLARAIEKFAGEVSQNVPCHVAVLTDSGPADARTALVLYRLARWAVRHAVKSVNVLLIELGRADHRFTLEIHVGASAAFGDLSGPELEFLSYYAHTAGIEVAIEPSGRSLRARAPVG
jgi:glucose-6-phosphate-specific signal transduction histidine kinase